MIADPKTPPTDADDSRPTVIPAHDRERMRRDVTRLVHNLEDIVDGTIPTGDVWALLFASKLRVNFKDFHLTRLDDRIAVEFIDRDHGVARLDVPDWSRDLPDPDAAALPVGNLDLGYAEQPPHSAWLIFADGSAKRARVLSTKRTGDVVRVAFDDGREQDFVAYRRPDAPPE